MVKAWNLATAEPAVTAELLGTNFCNGQGEDQRALVRNYNQCTVNRTAEAFGNPCIRVLDSVDGHTFKANTRD
jgi:hypothetical protein